MEVANKNDLGDLSDVLKELSEIIQRGVIDFNPRRLNALREAVSEFNQYYNEELRNFDADAVATLQDIYQQVSDSKLSPQDCWEQIQKRMATYFVFTHPDRQALKTLVLSKNEISHGRSDWNEYSFYGPKVAAATAIGSLFGISGRAMLKRIQSVTPFANDQKLYEIVRGAVHADAKKIVPQELM